MLRRLTFCAAALLLASTNGATRAASEPQWHVAVVGSNFSDGEITGVSDTYRDTLYDDAVFKAHKNQITFHVLDTSASQPWVTADNSACGFRRDASFGKALAAALARHPVAGLTSILVLNNGGGQSACAAGDVVISDRRKYDSIVHEFGHALGGLYDEHDGQLTRNTPVDGPNCVSDPAHLPWVPASSASALTPGCWYARNLWRPSENCIMKGPTGNHGFCAACRTRFGAVFAAPPDSGVASYTQYLVQITKNGAEQLNRAPFSERMPLPVVRGPIAAGAIADSGAVCLGGTFVDKGLLRTYQGDQEGHDIDTSNAAGDAIYVVMNCPGTTNLPAKVQFVSLPTPRETWLRPQMFTTATRGAVIKTFSTIASGRGI